MRATPTLLRESPALLLGAAWNLAVRTAAAPALRTADGWVWVALLGRELLLCGVLLALVAVLVACARHLPGARVRSARRLLAIAGGASGALLGGSLAGGAWIAAQPWSPAVPVALALAGAFVTPTAYALLVQGAGEGTHRRAALAAGGAAWAAAALVVWADVRVLAGLYPSAHFAAKAVSAALALAGARRGYEACGPRGGARARRVAVLALLASALGLAGFAAMDARTRAVVFAGGEQGSLLARAAAFRGRASVRRELRALLAEPEPHGQPRVQAAPAVPDPTPHYNVLLLAVDTLRADVLPPARSPTVATVTPFLDGWLAHTVRFARAYAPATITTKSMPALFYGQDASHALDEHDVHLASALAAAGYGTFAVVPTWFQADDYLRREKARILRGFSTQSAYTVSDAEAARRALEHSLDTVKEPFFGWVHNMDLHDPRWSGPGQRAPGDVRASYRAALAYLDVELASLMAVLERRGLLSRTIVVLLADHGELLGEHGADFHGPTVHEGEARVPFALRLPGGTARVVDGPVSTLDLAPTLLALLGVPPVPEHQGVSLAPCLRGDLGACTAERTVYVENASGRVAAVVRGHHKFLYNELTRSSALYDVVRDPGELANVYEPEAGDARALFRALLAHQPRFAGRELDEPETDALLARYLARSGGAAPRELPFVLALAAVVEGTSARRAAAALYDRVPDPHVRRAIVAQLGAGALGRPWPGDGPAPRPPRYLAPGDSATFSAP